MMVFCYNEFCICSNGTIDKLIIVRICRNEIPFVRRRYLLDIISFKNRKNNIPSHIDINVATDNLGIFFYYFVGYAQIEISSKK